jgi:hypothetical protein
MHSYDSETYTCERETSDRTIRIKSMKNERLNKGNI